MNDTNEHITQQEPEVLGSVTHQIDLQNGERVPHVPLRSSARVSKKLRLDSQISSTPAQEKPPEKKATEPKGKESQPTTPKRAMLWSAEDKNVFFKALNEYGKDFVSIQKYMNTKRRKRCLSENIAKNKDQARHFYYRTWHKISKYVKFPTDVKKATQELYGLINFGEVRKRIGFFNEKYAVKLNELIYSGTTQMRVRGKTIRIKTPVCPALRKLNRLEECPEDVKLPTRITVELRPLDNDTWSKVQSFSMNPRVRTSVPLQTKLLSLIEYLQKKWVHPDVKFRNKLLLPDVKSESSQTEVTSLLRVAPKAGVIIVAPSVGAAEFVTSSSISLLSYEQRFGNGGNSVADMLQQLSTINSRGSRSSKNFKKQQLEEESRGRAEADHSSPSEKSVLDHQAPASVPYNEQDIMKYNDDGDGIKEEEEVENIAEDVTSMEKKEEIIAKAKAGWTVQNAETLRIGDLYLMFGSDSKLQLEYWWEDMNQVDCKYEMRNRLSGMLQKLISMAKTTYDKEKVFCSCGHSCKTKLNPKPKTVTRNAKSNITDTDLFSQRSVNSPNDQPACNDVSANYRTGNDVESFTDQLYKLQPRYLARRRRLGDRQVVRRLVHLFSTPPVKQNTATTDISAVKVEDKNNDNESSSLSTNILVPAEPTSSVAYTAVVSSTSLFTASAADTDKQANTVRSSLILDQDEDSRMSNCSSIGRLLESTLTRVFKQSSSRDGSEMSSVNSQNLCNSHGTRTTDGRLSPHWLYSDVSNLSFSSLLAELDQTAAQLKEEEKEIKDDPGYSDIASPEFQLMLGENV